MILAIDLGTSRCKTVKFNREGEIQETSTKKYENAVLEGGRAEQNPEKWEQAVLETLSEVEASDAQALTVTGLGRGITFLNKEKQPVRNSILAYMDSRTEGVDIELSELNWGQRQIFENLSWVEENQPEVLEKVESVTDARDYIGYILTGELRSNNFGVTQEVEDAAERNGFVDYLPESNDSMTPLGKLKEEVREKTGLPEMPVYVAPWDAICSVLGSGINEEGQGMVICGSTTVTAVCLPEDSDRANKPHLLDGKRFYLGAEPAGSAYEWFRSNIAEDRSFEEIDSMIEKTAPAEGPVTLPFFKGGRLESLPGTIVGLETGTTEEQLARSVIEAEAYFLREDFEEFELEEVRISGGGARSHIRNRIRADVLGTPVKRLQVDETSALGAAMIAAAAEELHSSLETAISEMTSVKDEVKPQSHEEYDASYQRYLKTKQKLEQV